jgi:hypothetical protein
MSALEKYVARQQAPTIDEDPDFIEADELLNHNTRKNKSALAQLLIV